MSWDSEISFGETAYFEPYNCLIRVFQALAMDVGVSSCLASLFADLYFLDQFFFRYDVFWSRDEWTVNDPSDWPTLQRCIEEDQQWNCVYAPFSKQLVLNDCQYTKKDLYLYLHLLIDTFFRRVF